MESPYVTVYMKTNHMSAFVFSTDIEKVQPAGSALKIWSQLLVACPRYSCIYFYMRYYKNKHSQNGDHLRELKCFRIHSPLHVRVHRVAFSRGRRALKLSTCC